MYLFQQLKTIKRSNEASPVERYQLCEVEIDNPVSESKITVPAFQKVDVPEFPFKGMNASAFSLQTLFDAGVNLTPTNVVTTSFLRETEKFMNKVQNSKI